MTDRPIPMTRAMALATWRGDKTQTRRIVKLNGHLPEYGGPAEGFVDPTPELWGWETDDDWIPLVKEKPGETCYLDLATTYAPGDRLWVREPYWQRGCWAQIEGAKTKGGAAKWEFLTCGAPVFDPPGSYRRGPRRNAAHQIDWHQRLARFIPRVHSRQTLIVTSVRVERLQQIDDAGAMREGIREFGVSGMFGCARDMTTLFIAPSPILAFRDLWASINGPVSWELNPWVVAVTFRTIHANIDSPEAMAAE
jgi:hypothetical protein